MGDRATGRDRSRSYEPFFFFDFSYYFIHTTGISSVICCPPEFSLVHFFHKNLYCVTPYTHTYVRNKKVTENFKKTILDSVCGAWMIFLLLSLENMTDLYVSCQGLVIT